MSRYENRKTISLTRYDFVCLRLKDVSEVEGKSESAIIEEILMRQRPPLMPKSKELGDILLRYYLDSNACTKMIKAYFDLLSTDQNTGNSTAAHEMVKLLHRELCDAKTKKEDTSDAHHWVARQMELLMKINIPHIDATEWQMQLDSVLGNYVRYERIVQLLLRDWARLKENTNTYTILSLICECVNIACTAEIRYQIAKLIE